MISRAQSSENPCDFEGSTNYLLSFTMVVHEKIDLEEYISFRNSTAQLFF